MRSGKLILLCTICILLVIACAQLTKKTTPKEGAAEKRQLYAEKIKALTPAQCGIRSPPFYLTQDYFLIHANLLTYRFLMNFGRAVVSQRSHS